MTRSNLIPCPAPDCDDGTVYVHNAYALDPLKPEAEHCALCLGQGYILSGDDVAIAN